MAKLTALAVALGLSTLAGAAQASPAVSFNDDGTLPHTLGFRGSPVLAGDMLNVDTGAVVLQEVVVFDQPSLEDIDAAHQLANGQWVISTATSAFIDNDGPGPLLPVGYAAGDLILWDPIGETASLFFDNEQHFADPAEQIDAVFVIEGGADDGHILLSTATSAFLGTNQLQIQGGDIAQFDPIAGTASLFFSHTSFFAGTAAQQNIDALHIAPNGDLLISVLLSGSGLGGHTMRSQDITRYDGVVAGTFLDGTNLYDGPTTANLNAFTLTVPEPGALALVGLALLAVAARRSLRR